MKKNTNDIIDQFKTTLENYLLHMFNSMAAELYSKINDNINRMEKMYRQLVDKKKEIEIQENGFNHMKDSISNMFVYLDQLER
jgi:hypothetical protein